MQWGEIRSKYPGQWLVVEALEAHSEGDHRIMDQMAVLGTHPDSSTAFQSYRLLHREGPNREMFVVHTDREHLNIKERFWTGIRGRP